MALVKMSLDPFKPLPPLTEDQIKMLKEAEKMPYVYDEDNPPLTEEELKQMKHIDEFTEEELEKYKGLAMLKRYDECKKTVSLRLPAKTIRKAKSLGKGYTSILARIIEYGLDHEEILEKCL